MRAYLCDACRAHLDRPRDVRLLRASTIQDDEGAPLRNHRIAGRSYIHLCVYCFEEIARRCVAGTVTLGGDDGEEDS